MPHRVVNTSVSPPLSSPRPLISRLSRPRNPICGRQAVVTTADGTRSVTVTVVDKCPGCVNLYDLDLSQTAFSQLADPALGFVEGVEWVEL